MQSGEQVGGFLCHRPVMLDKDGSGQGLDYASSCCIPTTWKEYKLIEVTPYNHDTSIFAFGLDEGQSLRLPVAQPSTKPRHRSTLSTLVPNCTPSQVCGCILMANVPTGDEPEEVRPYTPISDNSVLGKFELLIKRYPAWGDPSFANNYKPPGKMSNYIHNLEIGCPSPACLETCVQCQ